MKNKKQEEIADQLRELEELSERIEADAKAEMYIDDDSYEKYRDSFRFMRKFFCLTMTISFLLVILAGVINATKPAEEIYITGRAGHVEEITPIGYK